MAQQQQAQAVRSQAPRPPPQGFAPKFDTVTGQQIVETGGGAEQFAPRFDINTGQQIVETGGGAATGATGGFGFKGASTTGLRQVHVVCARML